MTVWIIKMLCSAALLVWVGVLEASAQAPRQQTLPPSTPVDSPLGAAAAPAESERQIETASQGETISDYDALLKTIENLRNRITRSEIEALNLVRERIRGGGTNEMSENTATVVVLLSTILNLLGAMIVSESPENDVPRADDAAAPDIGGHEHQPGNAPS